MVTTVAIAATNASTVPGERSRHRASTAALAARTPFPKSSLPAAVVELEPRNRYRAIGASALNLALGGKRTAIANNPPQGTVDGASDGGGNRRGRGLASLAPLVVFGKLRLRRPPAGRGVIGALLAPRFRHPRPPPAGRGWRAERAG
jgi:hypothetical protein